MIRRSHQPAPIRQPDLLSPPCKVCHGSGRVPWSCTARQLVNFYRIKQGLRPKGRIAGEIEFQTCMMCWGTGRSGGIHSGPGPF